MDALFPETRVINHVAVIGPVIAKNGFEHVIRVPESALDFLRRNFPFQIFKNRIVKDGRDLTSEWADLSGTTPKSGLDWTETVSVVPEPSAVWCTPGEIAQLFWEAAKAPARSTNPFHCGG
jgi:hypothetical protein